MAYTLAYVQKSVDYIKTKVAYTPEIAIILGSCLGPFAEEIENPIVLDYQDIPHFLVSTVSSHAGKLIFGTICGKKVVCMSGRFHSYEGYDFEQLVLPIRVLWLLGARACVLTNAAGAVNTAYRPGDVMIISDHIQLCGHSPLRGPNVEAFGSRFFDVGNMYTPRLRELARTCAEGTQIRLQEGVYMFFRGPQFESPAEIRAAGILGADAVGMSTVTEALTAAHCHLPLLGLSVITNMAAGVLDQPLTTTEVDETARLLAGTFSSYMKKIVTAL